MHNIPQISFKYIVTFSYLTRLPMPIDIRASTNSVKSMIFYKIPAIGLPSPTQRATFVEKIALAPTPT